MYYLNTALKFHNGDVRLVNATNTNMNGRLEVYYAGQWGTVCNNFFDNNAAMVVCRQLGLNPVGAITVTSASFGQGVGPIWLDNVNCNGSEPDIDSCSHNAWGSHNCSHHKDVGVICRGKLILYMHKIMCIAIHFQSFLNQAHAGLWPERA